MILLFADDLKLFTRINSLDYAIRLQRDIDTIFKWCFDTNLQLNTNKCYVISFTRRHETTFQHFNYGRTLTRSNSIRDLGVTFDSKLSFKNHIQHIVNSAYKMLGFISRSLNKFRKIETYKTLYNLYVRSILEYGSTVYFASQFPTKSCKCHKKRNTVLFTICQNQHRVLQPNAQNVSKAYGILFRLKPG